MGWSTWNKYFMYFFIFITFFVSINLLVALLTKFGLLSWVSSIFNIFRERSLGIKNLQLLHLLHIVFEYEQNSSQSI